jgi:CHAT domain-containing protein/Tfp pilus assembly protein PilF
MLYVVLAAVAAASPVPQAVPADVVKRLNDLIVSGAYAKGLQESEALARQAERDGNTALQARALILASDALYYLNRQPETKALMERALALSQAVGDDEGIGRAYYSLSFLYERTEPERMVRLLETAQGHAAKTGDPALQMVIHNGLGNALETLSRPAEALEHYRQSTRFARELKQDHNLAVALGNMGIIENQRARYAEARALMEEADAIHAAAGPTVMRGVNLANLGEVWRALGEPERAREHYERSLAILEQFKYKRHQPGPLLALAELHLEQGERAPAEALRRRALQIAREVDDRKRIVWILCILAADADEQGRAREADELLQQAVEQARLHGDRGLRVETDRVRGRMALRRGDARGALAAADAAFAPLRAIGDPQEIGIGENLRSRALAALGRTAEAAAAGQRAVTLHARTATARYLHVWHGELARIYASMGQDARAREQFELSLARTENLDRLLAIDRFRLNLFREVADVFRSYAFWLAERGDARRAWEVLEQGRARELRLRLVQGGSEAVSPAETEALARLGVLQRKLREEELSRDDRQQLLAQAAAAEAEYERARQQAQRGRPGARENADALPSLPPDAIVVEYALSGGRLLVLSHRGGTLRARVVASPGLAEDVGLLRASVSDPKAPPSASARALGDLLLGPELQDAPDGRLLVVPDGILHRVPFAALETADGAFVSERFVLSQVPSLGVLGALRARPPGSPSRTIAVMANTRFTGGPEVRPRLAAAAREARAVARRARDPLLLLEASEAEVARLPFAEFQALHFASHVEVDEEHPERSRIVMAVGAGADDGYLQAREIERMRLPCRLVVVSGCRSGQGRILDGEGVVGLSHALHAAGARSLVMSHWDVTDDGAAEAMARFYELVPGRTVGEALRATHAQLRASSRFAHPAHWAAFFVSGDADQRLDLGRPAPSRGLLALILGLPLAVLATAFARRRRS